MTENKRIIKFRAWDKRKGKMIFGPTDDNISSSWVFTMAEAGSPYDDVLVLMQSTGLLDKNKTEIWEGDIVKAAFLHRGSPGVPFHAYIFYNDQIGSFRIGYDSLGGGSQDEIYFRYEIEVIGNLYENPELIKS